MLRIQHHGIYNYAPHVLVVDLWENSLKHNLYINPF